MGWTPGIRLLRPRMIAELDDAFWNRLLGRIGEGEVVPVVGPGAVTFGRGDELLYPWLAQRLPADLDPPLTFRILRAIFEKSSMLSARMGSPSSAFTSVFTNSSKIPICAQASRLPGSPPLKDSNSSSAPPSTRCCCARSRAPRPVESLSSAGAQVPCATPAPICLWS